MIQRRRINVLQYPVTSMLKSAYNEGVNPPKKAEDTWEPYPRKNKLVIAKADVLKPELGHKPRVLSRWHICRLVVGRRPVRPVGPPRRLAPSPAHRAAASGSCLPGVKPSTSPALAPASTPVQGHGLTKGWRRQGWAHFRFVSSTLLPWPHHLVSSSSHSPRGSAPALTR